jgi:hypothetical protein
MNVYSPEDDQDLLRIRETIVVAVASDEKLVDLLVLKGGNALDLVYKLGQRSSLDVDFSMQNDFADAAEVAAIRARLFAALRERFDALGFVVFDERFEDRPPGKGGPGVVWGGYSALFKLIRRSRFLELGGTIGAVPDGTVLEALRRESAVTGVGSQRNFTIEISKFEHTEGKQVVEVGGFDCFVYSPVMLAAEKLRAICQQSTHYPHRRHPTPRPRDFFDIHTVATHAGCDIAAPEHRALVNAMFAAKEVDTELLAELGDDERRAFHGQQWPAVQNSVRGGVAHDFDYYFDFVATEATRLLNVLRAPDPPGSGQRPSG